MELPEIDDDRVLVFAPIGRDGTAIADLVGHVGLMACVCATYAELVAGIEDGAAVVVVAEEGLVHEDVSRLARRIEAQPPWSDLPFLVLTSRNDQRAAMNWRTRLVSELRNVALLERPVQTITLTSTVQAAYRARSRQYEVRELLAAQAMAARELEAQVMSRTAELASTNEVLRMQMDERSGVEAKLLQAQKIEAIGQLTGGVAHDFNNLLMVISGGLEMLERNPDAARRRRLLEGMQRAAQRGAGLTRQLLAFSRRSELRPRPVNLETQVGEMRELLDRSLRGDVEVAFTFAEHLWPVAVDPGELELVLLNLAVNARDAMPRGGTIEIRAENVAGSVEDDIPAGDYVRLSVVDDGVGMSDEVKAHVFEPFFTTKEVGRGSGLGLAQVHGFAKQSGGTVRIESELGRGSTVALLLPRSQEEPAAPEQPPDSERRESAGRSGSVLLVEDDDEVAALTKEMLEQLGYEVTRAASAAAALGALSNGRTVDIVLSDIMMPGGMSGVDLAREIHARRGDLPVLLISGYADAAMDDAAARGVRVLPKPFGIEALAAALQSAAPRDGRAA